MDAFPFDSYQSYSDASTPRTPSPRTSVCSADDPYTTASPHFKPQVDVPIFDRNDEGGIVPEPHAIKAAAQMWNNQYNSFPPPPGSRGSLLDELNDEIPEQPMAYDLYHQQEAAYHHHQQPQHHNTWPQHIPQTAHGDHMSHQMRHPHELAMTRRATYPYGRHDGRDALPYPPPSFLGDSGSPYGSRPGTMYGEPLSMDGMPHHMDEPFAHSVPMSSPHALYDHPLDMIKSEDSHVIVPSQTGYGRPPSAGLHGLPCMSPHPGLLVQHTDDAASKETQYLRRRCFNCHTTEPPSWRRSTLNPGKIVCNKCGLYERTHLRPRPLRFDELRAGSKTRKQPKTNSPKVGKLSPVVKQEKGDEPIMQRRSSVSSSNGSTRSGVGASSDWDDNVSLASSGSLPSSSFNSPAVSTFSIPRDPNSQSPPLLPRDGGIRLPNTPLSDIASLTQSPQQRPASASSPSLTPRKSATSPGYYPNGNGNGDFYSRRTSCDGQQQQPGTPPSMPEVTGWQSVPMADLAPSKPKSRSNSLRKPVAAA